MPEQALDPGWWRSMADIFGPGGVVLLITNSASWYGLWLFWKRLKEKDEECTTEMSQAEARWETRFQQLRSDVKEAFGIVAKLTENVTILAERARTTTNTRGSA